MTGSQVRLQITHAVQVDLARARELFADETLTWLGDAQGVAGLRRRVATDLCLIDQGHHPPWVIRGAALVELGRAQELGERLRCEISWHSATLTPVLPTFTGFLTARPGQLHLEGYYTLRGGVLGRVLDRVLLNVATRATARHLLAALAAALTGEPKTARAGGT